MLILGESAPDGRVLGLTGNYMEVLLPVPESYTNRFARVCLEKVLPDGCWEGRILAIEAGDGHP